MHPNEITKPQNRQKSDITKARWANLRQHTGLAVKRAIPGRIDFSRDVAEVIAYYDEPKAIVAPTAQGNPTHRLLLRQRDLRLADN